ncbi:MAG: alpha-1,2-fucosyltransferase [Candidatus Brocadiaceae bacterium]|nr:alpha-1,2-fucosyltransferase [Candidatus Brocadiaceae bacterium]
MQLLIIAKAINIIVEKIKNPHFFVFSDDTGWVKENFKLVNPITVVDHNGPQKAYEDMGLMSLCKHHIIANSSFSWWGAWLCKNPNKIVVSPSGWFNDKSLNTNDFIPDGWIRI